MLRIKFCGGRKFSASKSPTSCSCKTILARSEKLASEAVQIWQYPETDYTSQVIENEVYTLEEEIDFRWKKIKIIIIQNQEFDVKNWWFAVEKLCRFLYDKSPTEFKQIINNSELSKKFSKDPQTLNGAVEFVDGLYVGCGRDTNSLVKLMCKLCDLLDFDKTEIGIEIV